MKLKLSLFIVFLNFFIAFAQNAPVISGNTMLCPYTDGTASVTNGETYDTYQWQFKYWFTDDDFEDISGANTDSFTYDWYTYDQALLKLVVTVNGQTYESNEIQIDSYAFASLLVIHNLSSDVEINPINGSYMICEGDYIESSVEMPYTIVQWFKDGQPISGATQTTYTFTEPGVYTVEASPATCPNFVETSPPMMVVEKDDCNLSIKEKSVETVGLIQNPVTNNLSLNNPQGVQITQMIIYDLNGKQVQSKSSGDLSQLNAADLSNGIYILKIQTENSVKNIKFIKE